MLRLGVIVVGVLTFFYGLWKNKPLYIFAGAVIALGSVAIPE